MVFKRRVGGEAGAERARSSVSQLRLSSSHQVPVAHWRLLMGLVRLLPTSSFKAAVAGYSRVTQAAFVLILLKVVGARFLPCLFFVPPSRPAWSP